MRRKEYQRSGLPKAIPSATTKSVGQTTVVGLFGIRNRQHDCAEIGRRSQPFSADGAPPVCVSSVSIAQRLDQCPRACGGLSKVDRDVVAAAADDADSTDDGGSILDPEVILIVRVPARPSRLKDISMPSMRRGVCARRSRPARVPGFFGQSALCFETSSRARLVARKRSFVCRALKYLSIARGEQAPGRSA
jgi:hypothetical protein